MSELQAVLDELYQELKPRFGEGKVASYIPPLARVDPAHFGMAMVTVDGDELGVGEVQVPFSNQSISKVFLLTLALGKHGEGLWAHLGREPSGSAFNSIVQLEHEGGFPRNPFINAGAPLMTDLVLAGHTPREAIGEMVRFVRFLGGTDDIVVDDRVARAEIETGYRNFSLAYFLRDHNRLKHPVEHVLGVYFHHCALALTCRQLARAGLFLAARRA